MPGDNKAQPRKKTITASFEISGVRYLSRQDLLNLLELSSSQFKREKSLLVEYCPELRIGQRASAYSQRQVKAFIKLRQLRRAFSGQDLADYLSQQGI